MQSNQSQPVRRSERSAIASKKRVAGSVYIDEEIGYQTEKALTYAEVKEEDKAPVQMQRSR